MLETETVSKMLFYSVLAQLIAQKGNLPTDIQFHIMFRKISVCHSAEC